LNWNKRWITLAGVSTILGVAFRLRDPENLLGKGENIGITCALVPTGTKGVTVNRRHDPLRVPFYNSPTQGKNVIVPVSSIIGGPEQAGNGWRMLMECLAAGRGISLPAQATGGVKYVTRVASAHAVVRRQFGTSIGKFEGIEEPLARIAGLTYLLESMRRATCGAIDHGFRPPITSAIAKYFSTEIGRKIINDAMDIAGGIGISLGPRNLLGHGYIAAPISITVEGANILTRTLIIFGQGVIRAHPYVLAETTAAAANDLEAFDQAFWGHVLSFGRNFVRAAVLCLSRGVLVRPPVHGVTARYWQKLSWASAAFAFLVDLHLAGLGGRLKKMESTSGRFADILSWMVLISTVLRRFESDGSQEADVPFMKWCAELGFARIQDALDGLYLNSRIPGVGPVLRKVASRVSSLRGLGARPVDSLSFRIAELIQTPGPQRDRLTQGIFEPTDVEDPFLRLERAFRLIHKTEAIRARIKSAAKAGKVKKDRSLTRMIAESVENGIVTSAEADALELAETERLEAVQVDDFSFEEYLGRAVSRRRAA
jgi:acyl-CoA dehydrogenase